MKRIFLTLILISAFAAPLLFLSHFSFRFSKGMDAWLSVTFHYSNNKDQLCRPATEEEKSKMLSHMRQETICERHRAQTRMKVTLDHQIKLDKIFKPLGLHSDGLSIALESFPISSGFHLVEIQIEDLSRTDSKTEENLSNVHSFQESLDFKKGQRHLIEFKKGSGFKIL